MSDSYWRLAGGDLRQDWSDPNLITKDDDWSGVPGIVGFRGDGLASTTGVDPQTILVSQNPTGTPVNPVDVNANQTNPNTYTTGGVAEFAIADPVVALQGSGTARAPYLALYLDATGRENVTVSFDARDIDGSADNSRQQIAVQYRLGNSGTWTNLPDGYIGDASSGPNLATLVTHRDVTLPSEVNNAGAVQVRIMTTDAAGSDEWIGIDNIVVTSSAPTSKVPGTLSIADASTTEGNGGTHALEFTVTRTGGADGAIDANYQVNLPGGSGGADASDFAAGTAFAGVVHFDSGQSVAKIALPVVGDTLPEFNEQFTVTLSNPTGGADIARATATGTILNDDLLPLLIGQIQGEGHTSPVAGQQVLTRGIVTGVDSNGFYIQDNGDGNARTSDGIFVFTGTAPSDVYVGDAVQVTGKVAEFQAGTGGLTVTEITAPQIVTESWGNALPDAIRIGAGGLHPPTQAIASDGLRTYDPATYGADFWESLEGMRVTIDHPLVVSNTTNDSFAETDVVASLGQGATGVNDRGGITIAPGDYNPEKIQIDGHAALFDGFNPNYTIGDHLGDVTGIVNYSAANYEVLVTDPVSLDKDVTLTREVSPLVGTSTQLSIATYNVENLDASDNKYDVLASNIVYNLRTPNIVALQEIQDANGAQPGGTLSGVQTAQGLIDAISRISGAHYAYVEIAPDTANSTGGEPNGNIRSGYLYNTDVVSYVDGSAQLITGAAYTGTRKPLVAQFEFNDQKITAIDVHLTSRGGSDPLWGATQPPVDAGDQARTDQAAGIKAWVQAHQADNPNIVILGDWNGFSWENAQTQLTDPAKGGTFTDLNSLLSPEERYSYLFNGNAQQIDHILVSGSLLGGAQYDSVHINSQFATDARPTDHDPQLALLQFGLQPTPMTNSYLHPSDFYM